HELFQMERRCRDFAARPRALARDIAPPVPDALRVALRRSDDFRTGRPASPVPAGASAGRASFLLLGSVPMPIPCVNRPAGPPPRDPRPARGRPRKGQALVEAGLFI